MSLSVPEVDACPFCAYLAGTAECAFVTRGQHVASMVNLRQYERGALLVVTTRHAPTVLDVDADALAEVYAEAARLGTALVHAFGATGLNIFQNNGVDAGQTVPHFHVHVVPRYPGSDPRRVFREVHFDETPMAERIAIAEAVRAALGEEHIEVRQAVALSSEQFARGEYVTLEDVEAELAAGYTDADP